MGMRCDMQKCDAKIKDFQDKIKKLTQQIEDEQRLRAQREAELAAHLKLVVIHNQTLTTKQEDRNKVAEEIAYCEPIRNKIKALKDAFKLLPEPDATEGKINTEGT